jgi:hypothetical protein
VIYACTPVRAGSWRRLPGRTDGTGVRPGAGVHVVPTSHRCPGAEPVGSGGAGGVLDAGADRSRSGRRDSRTSTGTQRANSTTDAPNPTAIGRTDTCAATTERRYPDHGESKRGCEE